MMVLKRYSTGRAIAPAPPQGPPGAALAGPLGGRLAVVLIMKLAGFQLSCVYVAIAPVMFTYRCDAICYKGLDPC